MNPRYPQPQGAPVDGMTKQLQMLSALKGLGGHQQIEQQQLQQNDDASRMTAALHLLGLQQQGEEQQGMQDFRRKQLALEGQRNQNENDFRNTSLQNDKDAHQHALAAQIFGDVLRTPGSNIHDALNAGGIYDPLMHQQADQALQAARAQAMERAYGTLKLTQDPQAREMIGRTQLAPFPGAFEELMQRINAPTPPVSPPSYMGSDQTTPTRGNFTPVDQANKPATSSVFGAPIGGMGPPSVNMSEVWKNLQPYLGGWSTSG